VRTMKIITTEKEISFVFPRYGQRYNPYMGDEDQSLLGEYNAFTGLIIKDKAGNQEMGFAHTIDMDYANKGDQTSSIIVAWYGSEEEFIKKCKELEIGYQVMAH